MEIKDFLESNKQFIYDQLFSLIRIPSVSSHPDKHDKILLCAERWKELLLLAGMDHASVLATKGNPVVFAEKKVSDNLPTVMVYGHYDVMPAEPLDLWSSHPFEPEIRDEKIFARGADDDKGQSFMHWVAFYYLNKYDHLKCNVKFILEGEEEIGSPSLENFCENHKELLQCDTILVSDTSMLAEDTPSITTGLRGLVYWQIEVTGANKDLHSGIFGGAIANPIVELSKIIAQLIDENGKITVPGFYDKVQKLSAEEKSLIDQVPFDEKKYKENLNIRLLKGENGYSTIERTGVRPTMDVCGIWGGYTGDGAKTVLPSKAYAKLSARLVPSQKYEEIASLVENYIKMITPKYVELKIETLHGAESYVCPIDSVSYKAAEKAYLKTFGVRPLPVRRGGSIGVVPVFEKVLSVKPILMGFGLESDAIHSPNENFPVHLFMKGVETIVEFYSEYALLLKV